MFLIIQDAKFIPALNDGTCVTGDFNLAMELKYIRNPDSAPDVGTLIKDDR
jgi:hypothetical protein